MLQHIAFQSIPADDQDRAIAFYCDVLGLKVHNDVPYGDDWRWVFLEIPGAKTRLQFAKRAEITVHETPLLALVSDDVDVDCSRWTKLKVDITHGPDDAPCSPVCAGPPSTTAKATRCL